jgi:transposase
MKEKTEYFVGIDISQKELEVAVKNAPIHFTETNTSKGIENLVERLKQVSPKLIVMEATGGL